MDESLNYRFFQDWNMPAVFPGLPASPLVRVYVDPATKKLTVIDSDGNPALAGSSSGTGVGNVVNPMDFGVKADGKFVSDMHCTTGSPTVTSAAASFSAADIGKVVFGTSANSDVSVDTSSVVVPQGLILAVIDQHTITVSQNAVGDIGGNGYLIWGTDDADALTDAWTAADAANQPLALPGGVILTSKGLFNTSSATTNEGFLLRQGRRIYGTGMNSTVIVPLPHFDWTTATGPNGNGPGAFFSAPSLWVSDLQLNGFGQSALGASANGKSGWLVGGGGNGFNFLLHSVMMLGWGAATNGFVGLDIGGGGEISGGWMGFCIVEGFGQTNCYIHVDSFLITPIVLVSNYFAVATAYCLKIENGFISMHGNLIGWNPNAPGGTPACLIDSDGAYVSSHGDQWFYPTPASAYSLSITGGATVVMDGAIINAGTFGVHVGSGSKLVAGKTYFGAATSNTGLVVDSGGIWTDTGGNRFAGGMTMSGTLGIPIFANNAAAVTGGLFPGQFYRTGADPDTVCVVH